ncbi:MAG TPA: hypothetical protein VNN07_14605 [Candidatus Tectomicrobia bacterium]|nr:hypothetical protein [Candidatus Tectomicrobia bacterium]
MNGVRVFAIATAALLTLGTLSACEKGPVQRAGERVDRAIGQEPVIGKGPVEEAGKEVDKAIDDVKR